MMLQFYSCGDYLRAHGTVPYKVWQGFGSPKLFYAKAGFEVIGFVPSQKEAIQLCNKYERQIS